MSKRRIELGRWGEQKAREYLLAHHVRIIAQNEHTQYGEIGLVGEDAGTLVFFEVKTRTSMRYGFPEVSVDRKKKKRLIEAALSYLHENPRFQPQWRIDVISVSIYPSKDLEIRWFKNAISG